MAGERRRPVPAVPPDWSGGIRVLFDIQHPAQVHLFRPAIAALESHGNETLVTSREKEMTTDLLDAYDIDHVVLSTRRGGLGRAALELGVRELRTLSAARSFEPNVVVSRTSPAAVHAARVCGCPSVVVTDTDLGKALPGRAVQRVTLPFASVVCRPPELDVPVAASKQVELGFQELAYLHPDRFDPDSEALAAHGVDASEPYSVVRLAGWDAYHDVGEGGLSASTVEELVETLTEHGTVYLSSETPIPDTFGAEPLPVPAHRVHDLLYYASLYVGDSGTMSTEAAMLGTPAVRTNSMVGADDERVFRALESEYGLLFSHADERAAIARVEALLTDGTPAAEWQRRRARLVSDATDVTAKLLGVIEAQANQARLRRRSAAW